MADLRPLNATSNKVRFKLTNSTTGAGVTGLTFSSTGLAIGVICDNESTTTSYTSAGGTIETITTLGTFATPTATKCRFKEVDATIHPGIYEFQFADARFSVAGSQHMAISVPAVSVLSLQQADYEIQLTGINVYDSVHGGMSCLPNTAVTTNASLITSGSGTAQLNLSSGNIAGSVASVIGNVGGNIGGSIAGSVGSVTGSIGGNLSGSVVGNVGGSVGSVSAAVNVTGDFSTTMKTSLNAATPVVTISGVTFPANFSTLSISAGGKINGVVLVDTLTTYTGNTIQTGDSYARIGLAGAGLTNLGDARIANLDAAVSTRMATFTLPSNFSILGISGTGAVSHVILVDTTTTNTDMRGTNNAALATEMTKVPKAGQTNTYTNTSTFEAASVAIT